MTINELISELERFRLRSGNIPVKVSRYIANEAEAIEWNSDEDISRVDYGCNESYLRITS